MNNQTGTIVNNPKSGTKLLGIEEVFSIGQDRKKGPKEISNLCRVILKANDTGAKLNLVANIPISEWPSILEASKLAFTHSLLKQDANFPILEELAKPKTSDVTDEGTLVYIAGIQYNSAMKNPIIITVRNYRGEVTKDDSGRMKYSAPKKTPDEVKFFISAREWLNKVEHIYNVYKTEFAKAVQNGAFEDKTES